MNTNENQIKQAIMKELFVIQKEKKSLSPNIDKLRLEIAQKKEQDKKS